MTIEKLKTHKKILILGYGAEGKATHEFLKKHVPNSTVEIADEEKDSNYLKKQHEYDLIIKTPGINKELVTKKYTTATNIFFANVKGTIIGVTGTKGKSTTASLIYAILQNAGLKAHLVGNIGNSMLEELGKSNTIDDYFVCELSSYQLDDCRYSPHISVITNVFPDHMNYHKTIDNYYEAKANIIRFATVNDFFVYNPKYAQLVALASHTKAKAIPYVEKSAIVSFDTFLIGEQNKDNIRAALTVARLLDISQDVSKKTISTFKTLPHRLQNIGTFKGITFYDDGSSVTPQSTIASLTSLAHVDTLLLGGQDRGYDFAELVEAIISSSVNNIVLFPDSGNKIKKLLEEKKPHTYTYFETTSLHDAVLFAFSHTKQRKIVLLSNASPSYTLWKNFVEKGLEFQKFVIEAGTT